MIFSRTLASLFRSLVLVLVLVLLNHSRSFSLVCLFARSLVRSFAPSLLRSLPDGLAPLLDGGEVGDNRQTTGGHGRSPQRLINKIYYKH